MLEEGPIAIGIWANNAWFRYSSGYLSANACKPPAGHRTNHAVQCVGYYDNPGVWIVMNSWGTNYGVYPGPPFHKVPGKSGFILLKYGTNTCNILGHPAVATGVRRLSGDVAIDEVEEVPPPEVQASKPTQVV